MSSAAAHAKINLALVVGPLRPDGKHEVVTVLQRLALADDVAVEASAQLEVEGFSDDTLVRDALVALASEAGCEPRWRATITKRIPVAAGLGGGSSDAATALRLANALLPEPLDLGALLSLAARLGADVPFFLAEGPQRGSGDGSELRPLALSLDYAVVLVVPHGISKQSTAAVYRAFDQRGGPVGFDARCQALDATVAELGQARDLVRLPPNDLASSPLARRLEDLGAFRADVSGAGPTVYGLFDDRVTAAAAVRELSDEGRTIVTSPAW